MPIVVDLRGTSGAGKSTTAKRFLDEHPSVPIRDVKGRILGYSVALGRGNLLSIVGRYTSPTGGCDTVPDMDIVVDRINQFWATGSHVLLEGLRTSGVLGRLGENSKRYGNDYVFAFLDTPLETCMRNVDLRRAARGALPLEDHKHTISKYRAVQSVRRRVEAEGRRTITVNWLSAKDQLLELFQTK